MELTERLQKLEAHAVANHYQGYCKFDALNSPLLDSWVGKKPISRIVATQIVNRVPLPLRQWLKVPKTRNPLGISNFLKGYCNLYLVDPRPDTLAKIKDLGEWLLNNDSHTLRAYDGKGIAYGYPFPWASPGFYAGRHSPNCYVTSLCGDGLLAAYSATKDNRYLKKAEQIFEFMASLPVLDSGEGWKCIAYVPAGTPWKVININSVAAGFLSKLYQATQNRKYLDFAGQLIEWVVSVREPDCSWNYTAPKSQSGIGPDNYHTGGILDGLWDYLQVSKNEKVKEIFLSGLKFYESNFFTNNGAPKWRVQKIYPNDIHGAAQGILTFSKMSLWDQSKIKLAEKILNWAMLEMQDEKGFFYYQKRRHYIWKADFMRWNNSWMFLAMSEFIKDSSQHAS